MPGHEVSEPVKNALKQVQENGHYIFINTGRTSKDIPDYIKDIDFDGGVYSAGGKVVFNGETLSENTLTDEDLSRIREVLDKYNINYILEGKGNNFCTDISEFRIKPEDLHKYSTEIQRFVSGSGMSIPKKIEEYNGEPVFKVNFRIPEEKSYLINNLNEELGGNFRVDYFLNIFSGLGTIAGEVTRFDINKGDGILTLCEKLNIPQKNTIAFGDSANDIDMIKTASLGVAMGNASDDLKEQANLICESCADDGIAKTLKRLELY